MDNNNREPYKFRFTRSLKDRNPDPTRTRNPIPAPRRSGKPTPRFPGESSSTITDPPPHHRDWAPHTHSVSTSSSQRGWAPHSESVSTSTTRQRGWDPLAEAVGTVSNGTMHQRGWGPVAEAVRTVDNGTVRQRERGPREETVAGSNRSVGESSGAHMQSRFAFLLPPQRLTESTESGSGSSQRRERRRRSGSRERENYASMDSITEMLLSVERIEQEENIDYEQMVMQTNYLLGGLSFHDEFSDMRMDIDNMSYEELLQLEENMGNVSTAISEDQFAKCLKTIVHKTPPVDKCIICQEEYEQGEKMGKLKCEHIFHENCIKQWLYHKNWCPVCKSSLNSK